MSTVSIDDKLREIALTDWEEFVKIVGMDSILIGKMRLMRINGLTYRQISIKLSVTESQVKYACKNLEDKNYTRKIS